MNAPGSKNQPLLLSIVRATIGSPQSAGWDSVMFGGKNPLPRIWRFLFYLCGVGVVAIGMYGMPLQATLLMMIAMTGWAWNLYNFRPGNTFLAPIRGGCYGAMIGVSLALFGNWGLIPMAVVFVIYFLIGRRMGKKCRNI